MWINADPADAPTAQRPVAFAFGELLPQPLCGRLFFNLEMIYLSLGSSKAAAASEGTK